ncbi:hypothetical protein ACLMJK_009602 [Lecanora helva]
MSNPIVVSKAERRRKVFLAARDVFNGPNSQIRDRGMVIDVIMRNERPLREIIQSFSRLIVCDIIFYLLTKQVFESELKAKLAFPELYSVPSVRKLQRQASELEAARSEQEAQEEITQSYDRAYEDQIEKYTPAPDIQVHPLRHAAVHRLPTHGKGLERMLENAVALTEALKDDTRTENLKLVLEAFRSQQQEMELCKNKLKNQIDEELADIQSQRETLDKKERELEENVVRDDTENTKTISLRFMTFIDAIWDNAEIPRNSNNLDVASNRLENDCHRERHLVVHSEYPGEGQNPSTPEPGPEYGSVETDGPRAVMTEEEVPGMEAEQPPTSVLLSEDEKEEDDMTVRAVEDTDAEKAGPEPVWEKEERDLQALENRFGSMPMAVLEVENDLLRDNHDSSPPTKRKPFTRKALGAPESNDF